MPAEDEREENFLKSIKSIVKRSTHEMQLCFCLCRFCFVMRRATGRETFFSLKFYIPFSSQIDDGTVNNNCELCNDTHHLPSSNQSVPEFGPRERDDVACYGASKNDSIAKSSPKQETRKKVPFSEKNNSIPNRFVVSRCYRFPRNILQFLR